MRGDTMSHEAHTKCSPHAGCASCAWRAWRACGCPRPTCAAAHLARLRIHREPLGAIEVVPHLRPTVGILGRRGAREVGLPSPARHVRVGGDVVEIEEDGREPVLGAVLHRGEHLGVAGVRRRVEEVVMRTVVLHVVVPQHLPRGAPSSGVKRGARIEEEEERGRLAENARCSVPGCSTACGPPCKLRAVSPSAGSGPGWPGAAPLAAPLAAGGPAGL